jgi:hypothetical protein
MYYQISPAKSLMLGHVVTKLALKYTHIKRTDWAGWQLDYFPPSGIVRRRQKCIKCQTVPCQRSKTGLPLLLDRELSRWRCRCGPPRIEFSCRPIYISLFQPICKPLNPSIGPSRQKTPPYMHSMFSNP